MTAARLDARPTAIRLATVVLVLVAWEALARSKLLYAGVVPPLEAIAAALVELVAGAEFYHHLWVTAFEVGLGVVIAAGAGIAAGILLGARRFLGRAVEPYLVALATTPKIIFLPIVMLMFGIGVHSKTALGALSGFFPVVLSTVAGMHEVRRVHVQVGRSFNCSALQMVRMVYLPSLTGPILTGLRLGLGVTLIGVLLAEIKISKAGLGFLANDLYSRFQVPELYALLIVIFLCAVLINEAMTEASRRVDPAKARR
jgi:ABC-type nitrate/sulfonate/bicarbonate transport system permease component